VNPLEDFFKINNELRGPIKGPFAPTLFGNAGKEHMEKYGTKPEHFAKIAWKNHKQYVPLSPNSNAVQLQMEQHAPSFVHMISWSPTSLKTKQLKLNLLK